MSYALVRYLDCLLDFPPKKKEKHGSNHMDAGASEFCTMVYSAKVLCVTKPLQSKEEVCWVHTFITCLIFPILKHYNLKFSCLVTYQKILQKFPKGLLALPSNRKVW